jgi:hypothetical protein
MEKKTYRGLMEVKAEGDQGLVRAVFATLNVEDSDGDITEPGAFGNQNVRLGAWGHAWQALPVGKGAISEEGDKAIFDGSFFLDTEAGQQHFLTVKNLAELQEWSYGFRVLESEASEVNGRRVRLLKKLQVFEVSPVMQGAGVDTMTVGIKGADLTFADHAEQVLADVQAFIERSKSLADLLANEGHVLTAAKRERLAQFPDLLAQCAKQIEEGLNGVQPEKGLALFAEYQRTLARLQGVAA